MSDHPAKRVKRVMTQAINLIFEFLKNKETVLIWLYDMANLKIEGRIRGFDEYMNLVMEDAYEVNTKSGERKKIGKIMLKGETISVIQRANP